MACLTIVIYILSQKNGFTLSEQNESKGKFKKNPPDQLFWAMESREL